MSTRNDAIQAIGRDKAVDADADHKTHDSVTKGTGIIGRVKNLIGKVIVVDEDWIFKSKEWPYTWNHKDTDNKA